MNYALIFAGGVGSRMNNQSIPKQFLEIQGKPIIIHTIENFEKHRAIEAICVVCLGEWLPFLKSKLDEFGIKKVKWLIPGGASALESQYLGLCEIRKATGSSEGDIVMIHDGVRPLINAETIDNALNTVKQYGSAITTAPAIETIARADDEGNIISTVARSECLLARAPQCFLLDDILQMHIRARQDEVYGFVDSTSMMLYYGRKVHMVSGPPENIKVTTPSDYSFCKALIEERLANGG